jgi:hypothetical protein
MGSISRGSPSYAPGPATIRPSASAISPPLTERTPCLLGQGNAGDEEDPLLVGVRNDGDAGARQCLRPDGTSPLENVEARRARGLADVVTATITVDEEDLSVCVEDVGRSQLTKPLREFRDDREPLVERRLSLEPRRLERGQ